jgi:hypothetical protein
VSGPSQRRTALTIGAALTAASTALFSTQAPKPTDLRGLAHGEALAATYHAILNADFEGVPALLSSVCPTTPAWCTVMEAVAAWWEISLDVVARSHDRDFVRRSESAIAAAIAWTDAEPQRAEAWFARGAAYGARAQWRVARHERLAAARDGKHIKLALERALQLDPTMHDAKFGLGMYRYYADVAPAALRFLRWLFLLPGGDRQAGLQQMLDARERGVVIRGEADYQLHLIYLWYEHRAHDALALVRALEHRYPRNPLFALTEAEIHHVYFHDAKTSAIVLRALIARAEAAQVNASQLALRRARIAVNALNARTQR